MRTFHTALEKAPGFISMKGVAVDHELCSAKGTQATPSLFSSLRNRLSSGHIATSASTFLLFSLPIKIPSEHVTTIPTQSIKARKKKKLSEGPSIRNRKIEFPFWSPLTTFLSDVAFCGHVL